MKMKISSKNEISYLQLLGMDFFRKPNITKHRDGPNMINFEKEIRDGAFDSDVPPMKVNE